MKLNKTILKRYKYSAYEVFWELSNSKIPSTEEKDYTKKVCYAQVPNSDRKKYKYIHTFLNLTKLSNILTKKDIKRFYSLCKKNRLLPHYCATTKMVEDDKVKGTFLLSSCTLNLLYIYLCIVRIPRETPGLAKVLLFLVDNGVNFFIALSVAHNYANTGTGHSILPIQIPYGDHDITSFSTECLKALKELTSDRKFKKIDTTNSYNLHNQLRNFKYQKKSFNLENIEKMSI